MHHLKGRPDVRHAMIARDGPDAVKKAIAALKLASARDDPCGIAMFSIEQWQLIGHLLATPRCDAEGCTTRGLDVKLFRCSRCQTASFCSQLCQRSCVCHHLGPADARAGRGEACRAITR